MHLRKAAGRHQVGSPFDTTLTGLPVAHSLYDHFWLVHGVFTLQCQVGSPSNHDLTEQQDPDQDVACNTSYVQTQ